MCKSALTQKYILAKKMLSLLMSMGNTIIKKWQQGATSSECNERNKKKGLDVRGGGLLMVGILL